MVCCVVVNQVHEVQAVHFEKSEVLVIQHESKTENDRNFRNLPP